MDIERVAKNIIRATIVFLIVGVIFVIGFWVAAAVVTVEVVQSVEAQVEENDSSLAQEVGKLFGSIKNDFEDGVEEVK